LSQPLLSVKEVSSFLKTSPSTLYRLCSSGNLPHIKKGFGIRFKREDLENWLDKDKRTASVLDSTLKKALTNSSPAANDRGGGGELAKAKYKTRLNYGYGAVYIRKTKSGIARYYADYRDQHGKRTQKLINNAKCWQEAQDWLKNAVLRELYDECGIQEKKEPVTLKEFVGMFIENYSKPNKKIWKDDQYRLNKAARFFGKSTSLDKLSSLDIEKFKAARLQDGVTPSTINTYLKVLKCMFNVAITWGYTQANPVCKVRMYSEAEARRDRVLTPEEEERLLKVSPKVLRSIILVALNTGMRRGEILQLKWEDIDLENRSFSVKKTKSGKPRTIPINSRLLVELLKVKRENPHSSFVFTSPKTGGPFKTIRKCFESACKKAEIQKLRFHDLRRTFGSRLALAGVDLNRIKELLGHASIKTTEIYLHADSKDMREAVEVLCQDLQKTGKKQHHLLHIRYTEKVGSKSPFSSSLFSVN
jgi:excisionase family DNA binding protein